MSFGLLLWGSFCTVRRDTKWGGHKVIHYKSSQYCLLYNFITLNSAGYLGLNGLEPVAGNSNQLYRLDLRTMIWEHQHPKGDQPAPCDKLVGWLYSGKWVLMFDVFVWIPHVTRTPVTQFISYPCLDEWCSIFIALPSSGVTKPNCTRAKQIVLKINPCMLQVSHSCVVCVCTAYVTLATVA